MSFTTAEYYAMRDRLAIEQMKRTGANNQIKGVAFALESDLHDKINDECRNRGWLALSSAMHKRTTRRKGEHDFLIMADNSRVFFFEAKSKTGKLSEDQMKFIAHAANLGHVVHMIQSFEEFLEVVK